MSLQVGCDQTKPKTPHNDILLYMMVSLQVGCDHTKPKTPHNDILLYMMVSLQVGCDQTKPKTPHNDILLYMMMSLQVGCDQTKPKTPHNDILLYMMMSLQVGCDQTKPKTPHNDILLYMMMSLQVGCDKTKPKTPHNDILLFMMMSLQVDCDQTKPKTPHNDILLYMMMSLQVGCDQTKPKTPHKGYSRKPKKYDFDESSTTSDELSPRRSGGEAKSKRTRVRLKKKTLEGKSHDEASTSGIVSDSDGTLSVTCSLEATSTELSETMSNSSPAVLAGVVDTLPEVQTVVAGGTMTTDSAGGLESEDLPQMEEFGDVSDALINDILKCK